jgi:glycerol-3-phosphate dehydrogenase (NAD(P)+)
MNRIAVLGAGSWGTALSIHFAREGQQVSLWARDAALARAMSSAAGNARYLPDVPFPSGVTPTASLEAALHGAAFVVVAVPSHGLRAVVRAAAPLIADHAIVVSAAKGLEVESFQRMSQVIAAETSERLPVVVLSGRHLRWKWRAAFLPRCLPPRPIPTLPRVCRNTSVDVACGSTRATTWRAWKSAEHSKT